MRVKLSRIIAKSKFTLAQDLAAIASYKGGLGVSRRSLANLTGISIESLNYKVSGVKHLATGHGAVVNDRLAQVYAMYGHYDLATLMYLIGVNIKLPEEYTTKLPQVSG